MSFWHNLKQSIYGPEYYRGLLGKTFRTSLGYFYALALTLALIQTALTAVTALPALNNFLAKVGPEFLAHFPEELVITIKDGVASTNVPEPYFIKLPSSLKSPENGDIENLIVIDTKNNLSVDELRTYRSMIILTRTSLVSIDTKGKATVQSLGNTGTLTLDRKNAGTLITRLTPLLKFVGPLFVIIVFIALVFAISVKLIYFIFAALLVFLVAKIKKFPIGGYTKAYQLTLHLFTIALIADFFFAIARADRIMFLPTLLLLVTAWFNLRPAPPVV